MATPSFLYFDLGNVLLSFCHERRRQQLGAAAGVPPEAVKQALFDAAAGQSVLWQFERGDLDEAAVYEHFCRTCGVRPDPAALWDAGCDIFGVIAESAALVQRLARAGNRLGILSNTNPRDWGFISRGQYPFLAEHFEHAVLSYEVGAMKPEAAIFEAAVKRAGVSAAEVFFVDDMPENVEGARAAGLDAVLFTSAADLERELRQRGVKVAGEG